MLDAAGFDLILIETVGVGQAEVAVASLADSVVVLLAPGMGDAIQAAKAGILEVADLFVVNKADKPDCTRWCATCATCSRWGTASPATGGRPSSPPSPGRPREGIPSWNKPWTRTGPGSAPAASWHTAGRPGARGDHRAGLATLRARLDADGVDELAARVAAGTLDPFQAAEELLGRHA